MAFDPQAAFLQVLEVLRASDKAKVGQLPREGLSPEECELVDYLEPLLPPMISRSSVPAHIAGITTKTLANLDCAGQGVEKHYVIGKSVFYRRDHLLRFLLGRGVRKAAADPFSEKVRQVWSKAALQPGAQHRG